MPFRRLAALSLALLPAALIHAAVPLRAQIDVTSYTIHADLDPVTGQLKATATVTFTTLEDLNLVTFGLNNGLQIISIIDDTPTALTTPQPAPTPVKKGAKPTPPPPAPTLTYERNVADSTVRVTTANGLAKGATVTWTWTYAGKPTLDTSPVESIQFARVADPISTLLYPGRWFPVSMPGLFTDRFTTQLFVTVPKGERVIASGYKTEHPAPTDPTRTEFVFDWSKPGFPGTVVAGKFLPAVSADGAPNVHVFTTEGSKDKAKQLAATAAKEFEFFTNDFGGAESPRLDVVELPSDTVSAAWAPGVVAVKATASVRLIANTVAHQWWGSEISPATLNDAWITNGMCRYAELLWLEDSAGRSTMQNAVADAQAEALAYDNDPLTTLGRTDPFSPQFQSGTYGKGAMVFHMLRWEMGDEVFLKFLRDLLSSNADKPVRTSTVQKTAESASNLELTAFFAQWLDGTGAPQFNANYSVFRLGKGKGFRTIGSVSQDLDLFKMPVQLRIETEGKTEDRRIDVSGTEQRFTVETFGRPRRIVVDPENWVLKSTPDLAVKVAILRGQQAVAQGDLPAAIAEYQKALDANRGSALANYRLAEIYLMQKNYQSAANSFRDALRGDGDPKWVEVWSHINLGKIFDVTGQRERAVNEYRQALQTNDNTQGALNEARALMAKPYKREDADSE